MSGLPFELLLALRYLRPKRTFVSVITLISVLGVTLGVEFARSLGLQVGDRLAIYSPEDLKRMKESREKEKQTVNLATDYDIRGIFDVGYFEYNMSFIITSLEDAQEMYVLKNSVHGL